MINFKKLDLNKLLILTGTISLILLVIFWFWWGNKEINIENENTQTLAMEDGASKSLISGLPCQNYDRRPTAIMISADPETRPLSGISQADIVFEMPVTPGGVTRMMAVYQCEEPKEIGSIRSAREDFIPLAGGLDATLVHWGGEREALKKLDSHIIDNIDAMVYETVYFYRKKGTPQPHNGFSDAKKILQASKDLNYRAENKFKGYLHLDKKEGPKNILNLADNIVIDYPEPFNVRWVYDQTSNTYKRFRGNKPEMDNNTGQQVLASVVVVIETTSKYISKDYLTVLTTGNGGVSVYQAGIKISGTWSKDPLNLDSKLYFYDNDAQEIEFSPGKIWIEVILK